MQTQNQNYETKELKVIRGLEEKSIKKWTDLGWEYLGKDEGRLRSTLKFRKPIPPTNWKMVGISAGVIIILLIIGGLSSLLGNDKEDIATSTSTTATATDEIQSKKTDEPSQEVSTEEGSIAPTHISSPTPTIASEEIITPENNTEFANILTEKNPAAQSIKDFAEKYYGRKIKFDGYIASASGDSLQDVLVTAGSFDESNVSGPQFKFKNIIPKDLGINSFSYGEPVTITATVREFNSTQEIFFLTTY